MFFVSFLILESWTKWPTFCRQQLKRHFLDENVYLLIEISLSYGGNRYKQCVYTVLVLSPGAADMPFVVYGDASIGKSSLLARIALDLHFVIMQPPEEPELPLEPVLVLRFLDRSPLPCNVEDLLFSLCTQISLAYGREEPDSHDVNDLMDIFQVTTQGSLSVYIPYFWVKGTHTMSTISWISSR